ncbi:MAG: ferredoxin--NADP reductase [Pseudomonadota bacterium]
MAKWVTGTVVENERVNERLTMLRFTADLPAFEAGQYVRIALEIDGQIVARAYSLVNAPNNPTFEVYFNLVPEGPLSPKLFDLKRGDEFLLSPMPNGFLTISEVPDCHDLWMVGTGTGVGPFLSILQTDQPWSRFEHIVLCYSVRSADELAYADLIAEIQSKRGAQFVFVPFVTRELHPGALPERIPACMQNGSLESHTGLTISPERSHVMMCGSEAMIFDVTAELERRDMHRHRRRNPGHFIVEKYH